MTAALRQAVTAMGEPHATDHRHAHGLALTTRSPQMPASFPRIAKQDGFVHHYDRFGRKLWRGFSCILGAVFAAFL
jgi:hypothetical protein